MTFNTFLIIYLILGIFVTILTYKYDGEELEFKISHILIGVIFWPVGVLWFLVWFVDWFVGEIRHYLGI